MVKSTVVPCKNMLLWGPRKKRLGGSRGGVSNKDSWERWYAGNLQEKRKGALGEMKHNEQQHRRIKPLANYPFCGWEWQKERGNRYP